jgi:hypothetical protein
MMKAMRAEHDQTMAELKAVQQNLHRYAIEKCPEPLMRDDERDRQRIEQMSSSPQASDKRRENKFSVKQELTKAVAVVSTVASSLFRGPQNEHQHRRNSQDHNNQHNFQSSAPHHNDQNNN